jgi:glycosyltransferase involved in cell wall biosynthesis
MTPELISVIIPTYNRPEMLHQAVASLQAQTDPVWEAVVVDDGDGTGLDLVGQLGDNRIRALMNKGKGQVQARNTVMVISFLQIRTTNVCLTNSLQLLKVCGRIIHF